MAARERRRTGGRRRSDLPKARWGGILAACGAGIVVAVVVQLWSAPVTVVVPSPVRKVVVPTATLERAQALRDQAEALTPTQVMLDERAQERWLPLLGELEQLQRGPETPRAVQVEVEATLAALSRAGIRR